MIQIRGLYFDGQTSESRDVDLRLWGDGTIEVGTSALGVRWPLDQVRITSRIGNAPRSLFFPDGAKCETHDNDAIDAFLKTHRRDGASRWLSILERTPRYVFVALVLSVIVIYATVQFGFPALARHVAFALPASVDEAISERTLRILDQGWLKPSTLSGARQSALREKMLALSTGLAPGHTLRVKFRAGLGPNAFALPSGTIVFTDALVNLASDDRELLAVYGHEVGHVRYRHALRNLLQSSATALLVAGVTGDVTSVTGLAATLPTVLLEAGFSRGFEAEADDFAYTFLSERGIARHYFADVLERMTEKFGSDGGGYLSRHPATARRVARFRRP